MPPGSPGKSTTSSTESEDSGILVPSRVYAELEALRTSGAVDMVTELRAGLEYFGFNTTRSWIEQHPFQYARGIERGFRPTNPDTVPDVELEDIPEPDPGARGERTDATTANQAYILEHLENIRHLLPRAQTYYREGSWRETVALTAAERRLIEQFEDTLRYQPRHAYHNSYLTLLAFADDYPITFFEGYVQTDWLNSPLEHAWFELDGKVIDVTLPGGPEPAHSAAYLGVEYDANALKHQFVTENTVEPLAPDYQPVTDSPDHHCPA